MYVRNPRRSVPRRPEPLGASVFKVWTWFEAKSAPPSVTFVEGGTWVDTWDRAKAHYSRIRGVREGSRVTFSTGAQGLIYQIPMTSCGDIVHAFATWAKTLALEAGPFDPYGAELRGLASLTPSLCPVPGMEYPRNTLFWNLTRRICVELDSRKAIPSKWELLKESVYESWNEFKDDTGRDIKDTAKWAFSLALGWLLVPALMIGVVYFGVIRRD